MTDLLKLIHKTLNEADENPVKANLAPVYAAVKEAGITDKHLMSFQDGLDTIRSQSEQIAAVIEKFRPIFNVQSDLTGEDLVNQITESLVRFKLYFYLAMDLYQFQMTKYGAIKASALGAILRNPKDKQLTSMFNQLPDEFKVMILSKDDILSKAIMRTFGESIILNQILKLVEDRSTDLSSLIADDQNTAMDILFDEAFNKFIRAFFFANVSDLPTIDENIYLRFSNPSKVLTRLRDQQLKVSGTKKTRDENDTQSDKKTLYAPVTGEGQNEVENDLASIPVKDEDSTVHIDNPDALQAINYVPKNEKEVRDKEVIFSHANLLLKYFNTPNWASIAAELLERLMTNPGSKVKYFNTVDLKFEDKALLQLMLDDTDVYLEDTVVRASLLTFDALSSTADILVTLTGEPVEINEEILGKVQAALVSVTTERGTPWFNIKDMPPRYKEEIRQFLKLDTIPSFNVSTTTTLTGNTFKDKVLDLLRREALSAEGSRKNDLTTIITEVEKTENEARIDALAKLAGIGGLSLRNLAVVTGANELPKTQSADEKKLAKKIGDTIYDKFATYLPGTTNKVFEYNGRGYVTRPEVTALILTMSNENLSKLWQDIQDGSIVMSNGTSFMSQTGASGQASIKGLTNAMNDLLKLRGVITESVEPVKANSSLDLENAYTTFFVHQAAPILQQTLVELKKLSSFLVAMIRLFNAYNNYLARGENAKHKYTSLSNEELEEIEDLQDFFVNGPNKHNFAGNQLVDDLRNIRIDEVMVSKIVNAYEANKDNPAYTSPINDPTMQTAFNKFKEWLMSIFGGSTKTAFDQAFNKYEQTGNIGLLREILVKNRQEIEARLKDANYGSETGYMSKLRLMNEIIRGTFGTPFAGKKEAPAETGATQKINPLSNFSF